MERPTKKIAVLSMFLAFSLILGLLERSIAIPIPIPGAKIGLSNIMIVACLMLFGFKEAALLSIVKSVMLLSLGGAFSSLLYSLSGGILSVIIMYFLKKTAYPKISIIGISVCGAIFHQVGQLAMASLYIHTWNLFIYFPYLSILSIFTGVFVGFVAYFALKIVSQTKGQ